MSVVHTMHTSTLNPLTVIGQAKPYPGDLGMVAFGQSNVTFAATVVSFFLSSVLVQPFLHG
jgi:hypothetical protein